eukprot:scaffold83304_cov53-Phaeocystis_antarctica.AAC.1
MRGAHPEHEVHVRDAGRVEGQRLIERRRGLPSRKEGVRCGARRGPGGGRAWAGGSAQAACTARGPGCEGWGAIGHARSARRTMRDEVWAGRGRAWAGGSARAACTARGPGCEGWGAIGHARSAPRTCCACP